MLRTANYTCPSLADVPAGLQHSAAVTAHGQLWTWGSNRHGRLGIGAPTTGTAPAAPSPHASTDGAPPLLTARLANAHNSNESFLTTAAMLAFSDLNPDSVHDDAKRELCHPPTPVTFPFPHTHPPCVTAVACGVRHTLALTSDGCVYGWGSNENQAVGCPDFDVRNTPVAVPGLPACSSIAACTVSAAVTAEGWLLLWGFDPHINPWAARHRARKNDTLMTPRSATLPVVHRCVPCQVLDAKWKGCLHA